MKKLNCFKCGNEIKETPAMSRENKEKKVCSSCGTKEALEAMFNYEKTLKGDK